MNWFAQTGKTGSMTKRYARNLRDATAHRIALLEDDIAAGRINRKLGRRKVACERNWHNRACDWLNGRRQ